MSAAQREQLDRELAKNIPSPCRWHPLGQNALFLTPAEREVVIARIEKVLGPGSREEA